MPGFFIWMTMADNILTTDRNNANLAIAAKDLVGVLVPRNIITDPSGADITPLTDAQLRATAVPVSGAFFPATQPVSIAATVPVSGTFFQTTQPVSVAAPLNGQSSGNFYPNPSALWPSAGPGDLLPIGTDSNGNLRVRGAMTTDEGSLREDFEGTSLTTAVTGTINFTNGSVNSTGTMRADALNQTANLS